MRASSHRTVRSAEAWLVRTGVFQRRPSRDEVHENQACGRSGNSGRLGHRGMVARPAEAQKPEAKPGEAGLAAGDPMRRGHAKPVRAARK